MTKKIRLMRICMFFLCSLFILYGCRQELLTENEETFNADATKFQVVRIKDIPLVTQYIKKKTGRNDLKISINSNNINLSAKANIDFANLESSIILKKTEGDIVYYIFNIVNFGDDRTIFNFEVKEIKGEVISDKILEYSSNRPFGENPLEVLRKFSGTVTAYGLNGELIAGIDYIDGENPCPPTNPPSTGNPPGGGISNPPGGYPNPSNPSYPSYPSFPSFPSFPSTPGGGSSGGGSNPPSEGCSNPDSYVLVDVIMDYGDGSGLGEFVNACGWKMYKAVAYLSASINRTSKITSPCDDGSGVVVLPFPIKNPNPCDRVNLIANEKTFDDNITALEGNTGLSNETGYRMGYPMPNTTQTGIQNQFLQNMPGTNQVPLKAFSNTFAILHTHYDGIYPMFSPGDIVWFNSWIVWAQNWNAVSTNIPKIDLKNLTFVVVTSNGNYILKFDGTSVTSLPSYTDQQFTQLNKAYTDAMNKGVTVGNVSGSITYNMDKIESEFLKFAASSMNMPGMKLYKRASAGGNTEIYLDSNGVRHTNDCPTKP